MEQSASFAPFNRQLCAVQKTVENVSVWGLRLRWPSDSCF